MPYIGDYIYPQHANTMYLEMGLEEAMRAEGEALTMGSAPYYRETPEHLLPLHTRPGRAR